MEKPPNLSFVFFWNRKSGPLAVRDADRLAARRDRDRTLRGLRGVARHNPKNGLIYLGAQTLDALTCCRKP